MGWTRAIDNTMSALLGDDAQRVDRTPRAYAAVRQITILQHPWSSAIVESVGERGLQCAARTLERVMTAMQEHPPG
jgi:hypothetical protein